MQRMLILTFILSAIVGACSSSTPEPIPGPQTWEIHQDGHHWMYSWDADCTLESIEYLGRTNVDDDVFPHKTDCGVLLSAPDPPITSLSLGGESFQGNGEVAWSDDQGIVVVSDNSGSSIPIAITNSSGVEVPDVGVASAANEEGVLILLVPLASSNYVPNYHFFEESLLGSSSLKRASMQSMITINLLEEDETSLIESTEIPPGPLENLWNSPGWEKIVTRTNDFCEAWSLYNEINELASLTQSAGKAVLRRISLKTLLKRVKSGFAISTADIALELCLAATGDGPGLQGLTTVVNDDLNYSIAFVDSIPDTIAIGRTVESNTDLPISGARITTETFETVSSSNGLFIISGSSVYGIPVDVQHDDYQQETTSIEPTDQSLINLGDISLSKLTTVDLVVQDFSDLEGFKQELKRAVESGDLDAIRGLVPDFFLAGPATYELMPLLDDEVIDEIANVLMDSDVTVLLEDDGDQIAKDIGALGAGEFTFVNSTGWANFDFALLGIYQDGGRYYWGVIGSYSLDDWVRAYGFPKADETSGFDLSDLEDFRLAIEYALITEDVALLSQLMAELVYAHTAPSYKGPREIREQSNDQVASDLVNVARFQEELEVQLSSNQGFEELCVEQPLASTEYLFVAFYLDGFQFGGIALGLRFRDGRYYVTETCVSIQ